jgi:catechol 2,3-dioxygenase-like lactoylglutathione lyase family enzyme
MITRFDHGVIAVRDLETALAHYRQTLGLDARPGGRHTGRGTHNGIVRFGLDYLELLSIYDPAEAAASGLRGQALLGFLERRAGGAVGFCLATERAEALAGRLRERGLEASGPFGMERLRPDGRLLRWRLVVPGGVAWRRPWPFFIQWDTPDGERLAWEPPGTHALGVEGVVGVAVLVESLEAGKDLYINTLGFAAAGSKEVVADLGARRLRVTYGPLRVDLLAPAGPGPLKAEMTEVGPGPFAFHLKVSDPDRARRFLADRGVPTAEPSWADGGLLIDPDKALGARLVLVEGPGDSRAPESGRLDRGGPLPYTGSRRQRPSGATVAQPTCNRKVGGFESPLGLPTEGGRGCPLWECLLYWVTAGGVAERPNAPDCKSGARRGFVGSNPTPSTGGRAHIAQR